MLWTVRLNWAAWSILISLSLSAAALQAAEPAWIWAPPAAANNQTVYFRKTFEIPDSAVSKATLIVTCDNRAKVWINGQEVAQLSNWEEPQSIDIAKHLKAGKNSIAVEAFNEDGPGGFVARIDVTGKQKKNTEILSGADWKTSLKSADKWQNADFSDSNWADAKIIAPHGEGPWGAVLAKAGAPGKPPVTPVETIRVPEGFRVELVHAVHKGTQGSWVSLTIDDKGRLIASDQGNQGYYRITPAPIGSDAEAKVEKLETSDQFGGAQGMSWAFGGLYVNINGKGTGVWKLTDTNGDDQFDQFEHILPLQGGGEHGPHAVIPTEDGKNLYMIGGNHTDPPSGLTSSRIPTNWGEDLLLPRQWDARGHARGKLAPGGWVAKISPDGKQRELISIGFRNPYDIALNLEGELFTFDADMEWDLGMPWYRPTRVNHITSGSEFGWRSGTGKWPEEYPDSLPAVANIGPASPTGVSFGTGAKFPDQWQRAFYMLDWTYGTIWAVHLSPSGSSYTGKVQEFVSGQPLPVTDSVVGKDGAFYFAIGGRGTQSAIYRVVYAGTESTAPAAPLAAGSDLRKLRKSLEAFHGKKDPKAVETAWPQLGHEDRHIRYAARLAVESQPVETWRSRIAAASNPAAQINAVIALARQGNAGDLASALKTLNSLPADKLSVAQKTDLARAYQLAFIRLGKPSAEWRKQTIDRLDPLYPAADLRLNQELCQVLVYLNAPQVVSKTIPNIVKPRPNPKLDWTTVLDRNSGYGGTVSKMLENMLPQEAMGLAFALRNKTGDWTLDERRAYFNFLNDAARHNGGASFDGFIQNTRKDAMANASNRELEAVADLTGVKVKAVPAVSELPQPAGPGKAWTKDELLQLIGGGLKKRDYENGKKMYAATLCILCHRFDGEGGSVGPDLSSVGNKFSYADLIDSILEPSKIISDQYGSTILKKKDGSALVGRLIYEEDGKLMVSVNPLEPEALTAVNRSDITEMKDSDQSMMPPGLIYRLNQDEVIDLLAYLMSAGNPKDRMFKQIRQDSPQGTAAPTQKK